MPTVLKKKWVLLFSIFSLSCVSYASGVDGCYFEKTRVIIQNGDNSGTITLKNTSSKNVLMYSKIEQTVGQKEIYAQSYPRLTSAKAGKTTVLRINVNSQKLPKDRETMMWLYTKIFPGLATATVGQNQLVINYVNRFKVFYRPKGINTDIYNAIANINWKIENGKLIAENKSPLHITMNYVKFDCHKHDLKVILEPFSVWKSNIKPDCEKCVFKWSAVNDYVASVEFKKQI